MFPSTFRVLRKELGLTQAQLADVMGYAGQPRIAALEDEYGPDIPAQTRRLMLAYVSGYRPHDWPAGAS